MKIGILTFHRAHNYGAMLQCYALQEYLKSKGYIVSVIDYRQAQIEDVYRVLNIRTIYSLLIHPRTLFKYLIKIPHKYLRALPFRIFRKKYINTTNKCYSKLDIPQDFDAYIIGSDQLWGLHCTNGIIDEIYTGNFVHKSSSKIIGYAISSNIESLHKLGKDNLLKYINNFNNISFRDTIIKNELEKIICEKNRLDIVLDPTLLIQKKVWDVFIDNKWNKRKFVLLFLLRCNIQQYSNIKNKCLKYSKQKDIELIDFWDENRSFRDYISLFKFADFIITTSFHALSFSLIFNKKFNLVNLNDGHDNRANSLLQSLSAEKCIVNYPCLDFDKIDIDYSSVNKIIDEKRIYSESFLINSLNKNLQ